MCSPSGLAGARLKRIPSIPQLTEIIIKISLRLNALLGKEQPMAKINLKGIGKNPAILSAEIDNLKQALVDEGFSGAVLHLDKLVSESRKLISDNQQAIPPIIMRPSPIAE